MSSRRAASLVWLFAVLHTAAAESSAPVVAAFGEGSAAAILDDHVRLLEPGVEQQTNVVAWARPRAGASTRMRLTAQLRVLKGGEGGGIAFLATKVYGAQGPGPYLESWEAPGLARSFAVGIDVSNPPNEEPFGPLGNYRGLPEREVSLHWDGREIVKRLAAAEFRGDFHEIQVTLDCVSGGADVTVQIGEERIYDAFFIAGIQPYEMRLAAGARTSQLTTEFELKEVVLEATPVSVPARRPLHVPVFNHVLTDNSKTRFESDVALPPGDWAYGRVILNLDIHDAGDDWDEWDRNANVLVKGADGVEHVIVPFITSYRTECSWAVDVTHFRPWLSGDVQLIVVAGTKFYKNRGFMMSVSLDYYPGAPALEPFQVVPLWEGTARCSSEEHHFGDFFDRQVVPIPDTATAARLTIATSGHSQVGEFTPSGRKIVFAPDAATEDGKAEFANRLWKDDCYLNPNRPQFGTWKYSRAGWAPGDIVHPWWVDLTEQLVAGQDAAIEYRSEPYDWSGHPQPPAAGEIGKAQHVVNAYLILYREPAGLVEPPTLLITGVAKGSAAAGAGLKPGDYLATYNGATIRSIQELRDAIGTAVASGADNVPVVVFRDSDRLTVDMAPGKLGVNLRGP